MNVLKGAVVVALSVLMTARGPAQILTDKKASVGEKVFLSGLEIRRFDAVRDGRWIYIVGKIENVSPRNISFTYTISNSGTLIQHKADTLILGKQSAYVRAQVPVTNNAMKLNL